MFTNYFKIAWRNLTRTKVYSLINIAGLSIGIACVILITLYVQDELSFDRFYRDADRIYQVNMRGTDNGAESQTGNTAPAVGPTMVNEFPGIGSYARIYRPQDGVLVRYQENGKTERFFTEKRMLAVDSNFLQIFTYALKAGDPATCLNDPNALVITAQTATKYFGNADPIGKTLLLYNDRIPFRVTAVLDDIPAQSSFEFDMLAPVKAYPEVKKRSWNWNWLQVATYVKLNDGAGNSKGDIARLEAGFKQMVKQHAFRRQSQTYEEFVQKGGKMEYYLQPFTSVHLYAAPMGTTARLQTLGNIKYIYIFSAIAVFIILLACVNFMNLSTAQSAKRAKEVGIRKVLGSDKKQLVRQFLTEAMLYSMIATVIALLLVWLFLSPFNEIADKSLVFSSIFIGNNGWVILLVAVCTGLLAGSYPAWYLTSFNPVTVLKGVKNIRTAVGHLFLRNGLVVFQFTTAIVLIICTLVVFKQLKFTQTHDLGLDKENVIVIANTSRLKETETTFRQELTRMPGVAAASISSSIPTKLNFGDGYKPEQTGADIPLLSEISLSSFVVDEYFAPTLQITMLKGRNFAAGFNDSASVIINESAAKQIGWKNPVGKYLNYPGNSQRFQVIGVAKNFNIESMRESIAPFALFHTSSKTYDLGLSYISVRMQADDITANLRTIEKKWKTFAPDIPFDYSFLSSDFEALYRSEQRMGTVFSIFTVLSIFVACLGLFGLTAYTAETRTKEIGIRKVLGAPVFSIVRLLSRDFIRLVILATVIAFPLAWWTMSKWLEDFVYRITIGWQVFILSALAALFISIVTISFQSVKSALANPVKSLRTE
jgi:putative ABC transport system permease protein